MPGGLARIVVCVVRSSRAAVVALVAAGCLACGSETDDRPATLPYITATILAPSCATAACHSAFRRQIGDQFDTVEAARISIVANDLVAYPDDLADPRGSYLVRSLTVGTPSLLDPGAGNVRMPYDAPLPDADVALIEAWIAGGAHGAQCVPNAAGRGCAVERVGDELAYRVVECADGDVGATVTVCAKGQVCTFNRGNGQCLAP